MTELFGVVNIVDEMSGTIRVGSFFPGTWLKTNLALVFIEDCNGGKIFPGFQRQDVDPSSAFWTPPKVGGISLPK